MKHFFPLSILLAASLVSFTAFAQDTSSTDTDKAIKSDSTDMAKMETQTGPKTSEYGKQADQEMKKMDSNQDQKLSQDEAQMDPMLIGRWVDFDLNVDGSIDQTEYLLFAAHRTIEAQSGQSSDQSGQSGQSNQQQQEQSGSQTKTN